MKINIIFVLLCSLIPESVYAEKCASRMYTLDPIEGYYHSKYAPSPQDMFYISEAFVASIDGADVEANQSRVPKVNYLAQPHWVATHLKAYQQKDGSYGYAPGIERPNQWYRDNVFDSARTTSGSNKRLDESYTGSGSMWNRGHWAQRADANRMGPEYGCNTHTFANAFPQAAAFNQGIWLGLENYISGLSNQLGELWIVTGPIFTKELGFIGDSDEVPVAIPDKAFKVVIWEHEGDIETLAFIYPNIPNAPDYKTGKCSRDESYDHSKYYASITEIEDLTGLEFFDKERIELKQKRTVSLPYVKKKFWVGSCR
ncbi:DNA/RNA non-specific endonuclease [Vibrio harveyi]